MNNIVAMLEAMTPAQRESLAAVLLAEMVAPPPLPEAAPTTPASATSESYYDMEEAVPVTFKATLQVNPKSRDKSYAERFDHIWCKGHANAKGPKGGVYFVGRCVMGVKKGQQVKGILRVGNKHFTTFQAGGTLDAWVRFDGDADATLIGTLSAFTPA